MIKEIRLAPKKIFNQMLKFMVVPTFDLVIEYGDQGVVVAYRKISPYKNVWALPGLRMYKGENIDDTLRRIAMQELGLKINPKKKICLGQYVGKFKTDNKRQDLSSGYWIKVSDQQKIKLNTKHFTSYKIIKKIPVKIGGMYKFYLKNYLKLRKEIKNKVK